jgi:uncharacterized membrane protein YdjX (TVP38/TMEM64 family)
MAVQGQTGAQPEGAFFNFINWIGNVVAPVGAGGAVFGSIVAFMSRRHMGRSILLRMAVIFAGYRRVAEYDGEDLIAFVAECGEWPQTDN